MMNSRENNLIAEIHKAFADVQLEDGISLNMTEYHDSGGSRKHYAEKAVLDERHDWRRIDDKTLEDFTVTFSFTDLKGFRFYVPAYMIYSLRNHKTSDSIICDKVIYAIHPDHYIFKDIPFAKWFTKPQIAVMTAFLEYCCDHNDTLDGDVAAKNLQKFRDCMFMGEQK